MKKILIVHELYAILWQDKTFLNREDLSVFVPSTNDEALQMHEAERMDLIITKLVMPGMATETFCSRIRDNAALRDVSLIVICPNSPDAIKASGRCRANAVILEPVHRDLLIAKAQQLLFIATRQSLRVILSAEVESRTDEGSFYCRTRNVSVTGMLIETDKVLAEGTALSCQFYLPSAKKIKVSCSVVRILEQTPGEDYQYGLIFTDISDSVRTILAEYVEEAARKSGSLMSSPSAS